MQSDRDTLLALADNVWNWRKWAAWCFLVAAIRLDVSLVGAFVKSVNEARARGEA